MEEQKGKAGRQGDLDIADLQDDPELQSIYSDRLAALQKEAEKRQRKLRAGHGELGDIQVRAQVELPCVHSLSCS